MEELSISTKASALIDKIILKYKINTLNYIKLFYLQILIYSIKLFRRRYQVTLKKSKRNTLNISLYQVWNHRVLLEHSIFLKMRLFKMEDLAI